VPYRAPIEDYQFLFDHVANLGQVVSTDRFCEATPDIVGAILSEAGRMCEDVLFPLQRAGDQHPAYLENGVVRTSPGFAEGYQSIADGGWVSISAPSEFGGMDLPMALTTAVNEMMSAACLSLQLNPLMTQGQIEALAHHASDALKETYLPKLVSGQWAGTMNLTESQAGSDVGALRSSAEPNVDGTFAVSGQKIFISWGDNDFTENVCHLVLARLPGGEPGTKGISLFLVPKFIPDMDGNPGVANTLSVVGLEHKMGLHGSPTAILQFDGATGWLVGERHDGLRAMFTMMNNARLGVGGQGIGAAEGAYQHALAYTHERKQGRSSRKDSTGSIIDHADVRRMLATMKANIFVARSIALSCAVAIDMQSATGGDHWASRAALLTPIAKAYGTDTGCRVSDMGVQVHGGMGYIEETGAAQYFRDVRVTAIYEGTNGIQSMDLVGRKLMDGGAAAFDLLDEIDSQADTAKSKLPDLAALVRQASAALRDAVEWMVGQDDMDQRNAGAVAFLTAFATVLGGHFHLIAAIAEGGSGPRSKLARFYITRLLPEHASLLVQAMAGSDDLFEISPEELGT